jgi:RimJ/RimL family protein N-acetyltransferase
MISVRDLSVEDVPSIVNYWFHSPPGFIEGMGVDLAKLPSEAEMLKSLIQKCQDNALLPDSKINAVVILKDGEPVGFHTLFPIAEGDHGIFHAHIWNPEMRGQGIALNSYLLAAKVFMKRFNLNRILYKTPLQNVGSIRVKEKLGIRSIGEEIIGFGIIKEGTRSKVFELTKEELNGKFSR